MYSKVNFLFLIENINLRGGTEIQTLNITHALNEAGYSAKILSITPYNSKDRYILSLPTEIYDIYVKRKHQIANKIFCDIISDHYLAIKLCTIISQINPKILVNQTYDLIHLLPFKKNIKIIQVFNWSILGYEESILQIIKRKKTIIKFLSLAANAYKVRIRHLSISNCNNIVILTHNATKELKLINNKIKDSQIAIIPNPLRKDNDSQELSSLNNHNIVFVGRLSHEKGVLRLLHIWEYIYNELPNYTLSIYGTGEAQKEMEEYINRHNLKNIIFKGFEKDHNKIYTSADLLISTSDSEGFGLVFIEAFYYGVPAISFNCPVSPKEVIGNAGILIECFNEKKYSEEVISLLQNKKRLKILQNNAIVKARDYYENKIVNKWIKLLP